MSPADKLQLTAALIERARCGPRGVALELKNRVLRDFSHPQTFGI